MAREVESELRGWGRHSVTGVELFTEDLGHAPRDVAIARGLGRSYGDASLPPRSRARALNTTLADRILSFDPRTRVLRAEAGFSLVELNRLFVPRGFFPPVTPGTKYVTLGGMVAADVHGKNQHAAGNIGHHVRSLAIRVADGRVVECSREEERELFLATIGGMGLTGVVLEVELALDRIPTAWIRQESRRIRDIDEFQEALEESAPRWPFTVGWIDCLSTGRDLGRGTLMCGRWAEPGEAPARPPAEKRKSALHFDWPEVLLNPLSIHAFNTLNYWRHLPLVKTGIVDYESFWYPLDAVREWNRMYGKRGFTQYQCVLPRKAGRGSARRLLELLTSLGGASFLAVIKDFGKESEGMLSFPTPGITVALDIPVRDDTQRIVDALNELVIREGGRIYLAKDSFTRAEHYRAMDPRIDAFNAVRDRWDPDRRYKSALSVRLLGDDR